VAPVAILAAPGLPKATAVSERPAPRQECQGGGAEGPPGDERVGASESPEGHVPGIPRRKVFSCEAPQVICVGQRLL
jgi:hypothetical protein